MALLRSNPDFDIFHDGGGAPSPSRSIDRNAATAALRSLPVDHAQNFLPVLEPSSESPVAHLKKFHIQTTPKKADPESILKNKPLRGCQQSRTPIRSDTFVSPQKHAHFDLPTTPTAATHLAKQTTKVDLPPLEQAGDQIHILRVSDPFAKEQLAKHRAGQFDWMLSVPVASTGSPRRIQSCSPASADAAVAALEFRRLYFGCNLLHRRSRSGGEAGSEEEQPAANTFTLIATPIDGDEHGLLTQQTRVEEEQEQHPQQQAMSNPFYGASPKTPNPPSRPFLDAASSVDPTRVSPKSLLNGSSEGGRLSAHHTPARSPGTPSLRIEDSFEELDRLEDQFEAVDTIVQVKRVPSPDKMAVRTTTTTDVGRSPVLKRNTSTTTSRQPAANGSRPPSVRPRPTEMSRTGSARKSASRASSSLDENKDAGAAKATPPPPKKTAVVVPRPASLLPPKPLAKSGKTPTMPTFELPGEAVARRLKEQKEARMSGLVSAADAAALPRPPSPQKIKSNKVPTRPTFELPGEAISRRKREEHAAKLRAQEEEERRRREFKARPVRNSIAPGSYPRETIASRARQTKAAAEGGDVVGGGLVPGSASKRHSMMPRTSLAVGGGVGSHNAQARGRGSTIGSTQASRAASSSTGSTSGKHSTVSAEDVQHQKQRGKEVYSRDNSITTDRERERRDREAAAKIARQEAAERSRMLSREWAEKQKMRLKKATPPGSPSGLANLVVR